MSVPTGFATPESVGARRELLVNRLLEAAAPSAPTPLSFAQERLWFLDQLLPNSSLYNMPSALKLTGPLNRGALEAALTSLVARHESLRTRFVCSDGEPAQIVEPRADCPLPMEDLSAHAEAERTAMLRRRIEAEAQRPFNLSTDRLLRGILFRLSPEEHVLFLNMHHIISDEWSWEIFYRELAMLYTGRVTGQPAELPELPIQYADFAQWQREWLKGEVYEQQLAFWKRQLDGNPPVVELPTDRPRHLRPGCPGAAQWRALGHDLSAQLKELAKAERATLFMVMLAGFKALLFRYTQQEDLVVGSPIAGRNRLETESLIGFFVNTLLLRTRVSGDMSFRQLVLQVRGTALEAFAHQDFPFERLVAELHPDRSVNAPPFVRVLFFLQNHAAGALELPGLKVQLLETGVGLAKFDLTLAVHDTPNGLVAVAQYNADLFAFETISRLLEHYSILLGGAVAEPGQAVASLPLLSDAERDQLLVEWNNTRTDYPRDRCVQQLFEEQVRLRPRARAVTFGDSTWSYDELNGRANQLARHLRALGVLPGMRVGICLERSLEMVVAILAILKAGAAYAPLDPGSPQERLAQMLGDLQVPLILTQQRLLPSLPDTGRAEPSIRILCLDADEQSTHGYAASDLACAGQAEDVAYISFTSGSTGRPKGVCLPHRGIVRLVRNTNLARFCERDVFLQLAPISFDASLLEIWGCLLNGGRLVVAPAQLPSLTDLADLIRAEGVTTAWLTTGLFNQMVEEKPESLKPLQYLITGGDVASPPHINKALRFVKCGQLINGYGPSENTTFTTCYRVPADFDGERPLPIGRPISNTECFILDAARQPVPIGVPGELYVGGDGLATGYLNRPELTAERFVPHPFRPTARLYKTGDLGRYRADGTIEFLGRMDFQVKIRGFRVEPGEVEAKLLTYPGVRQCCVTARPDAAGTKQLVAYIVPAQAPAPAAEQLRTYLRQHLPEFMVPAWYVTLPEFPLSRSGKVDRKALPAPETSLSGLTEHLDPRDAWEEKMQEIWETTLKVRPIGVRDKFFALGGHSLLAVRLVARIEQAFGTRLPVAAVFEDPTVERLTRRLRGQPTVKTRTSITEIQPLGSRPPLFLVHGAGSGMFWGYSNLARHMGQDQPVFAFKSRGMDGQPEHESIQALAEAYLADLRAFQPHGPYYLGGYCFGGVVAYEMAHRLHQAGQTVGLLALINSVPPNSRYTTFRWTPLTALKFLRNSCLKVAYSMWMSSAQWKEFLRWRARLLARSWRQRAASHSGAQAQGLDAEQWLDLSQYPEDQQRLWEIHIRALTQYEPPVTPVRATLFRSPLHLLYSSFDAQYGWGDYAEGGVAVKVVPGAHDNIMEEPRVRRLALELKATLEAASVAPSELTCLRV